MKMGGKMYEKIKKSMKFRLNSADNNIQYSLIPQELQAV